MSQKSRIARVETAMRAGKQYGVLEIHAFSVGPCPKAPQCPCLPCDRPGHDPSCRVAVRVPADGSENLVRSYGFWPCALK